MINLNRKGLLALLLLTTLLSGCWSRKEINESAIVAAIGVDRAEAGYRVTVQITNHGQVKPKGGENQATSIHFSAVGPTVSEALKSMTNFAARRLDFVHNWLIVIGEEQARAGVIPVLDFFIRAPEARPTVLIAVAQGSAKELLSRMTYLTTLEAKALASTVRIAHQRAGRSRYVTLLQAAQTLTNPDLALALPFLIPLEPTDPSGSQIDAKGVVILKAGRLVGQLTPLETHPLLTLINERQETSVSFPCPDDPNRHFTINSRRVVTRSKVKVSQGTVLATYWVTNHGDLGEYTCRAPLQSEQDLNQLQDEWKRQAEQRLKGLITKLQQELKADALGLAELVYRSDPAFFKGLQGRWQEQFAAATIQVILDAQLHLVGGQAKPILGKGGENP